MAPPPVPAGAYSGDTGVTTNLPIVTSVVSGRLPRLGDLPATRGTDRYRCHHSCVMAGT